MTLVTWNTAAFKSTISGAPVTINGIAIIAFFPGIYGSVAATYESLAKFTRIFVKKTKTFARIFNIRIKITYSMTRADTGVKDIVVAAMQYLMTRKSEEILITITNPRDTIAPSAATSRVCYRQVIAD